MEALWTALAGTLVGAYGTVLFLFAMKRDVFDRLASAIYWGATGAMVCAFSYVIGNTIAFVEVRRIVGETEFWPAVRAAFNDTTAPLWLPFGCAGLVMLVLVLRSSALGEQPSVDAVADKEADGKKPPESPPDI